MPQLYRYNPIDRPPAHVIAAESDPEWGPAMQERMTMLYLEHGKLVTVKGSGHLVPIEAPEELVAFLRAFATA